MTTKTKTKDAPGYVIYDGPSLIDGGPIVAILTLPADPGKGNRKIGEMAQITILRRDVDPVTANRLGLDRSICGDCPLKGIAQPQAERGQAKGRGCYVVLIHRPAFLFKAYHEGRLPRLDPRSVEAREMLEGLKIRVGAYGDGASVPGESIDPLVEAADGHTDYTHQLGKPGAYVSPSRSMISCETLEQARTAWRLGFRTFRTILPEDLESIDTSREIICPATEEGGKRTTCAECGLCAGLTSKSPKSIVAVIHGNSAAKAGARSALELAGA